MLFRSTNSKFTHFQGDVLSNIDDSSHGVHLAGGSTGGIVQPCGDEDNIVLAVRGKGTGFTRLGNSSALARIGASTTGLSNLQRYLVEFTPPALASTAVVVSTYAVVGLTTNAAILALTPRLIYSSNYVVHGARCSTADELSVTWSNLLTSTIGTGESTNRWTLLAALF